MATILRAGETLKVGEVRQSTNSRFRLTLQDDGNLVLYEGDAPRWDTGTSDRPANERPTALVMEEDGNLVLTSEEGTVAWSTGTTGHPGARLALRNDGNLLVLGDGTPARELWGRLSLRGSELRPGDALFAGQAIESSNGRFRLVMQFDGNLALYESAFAVWDTATARLPAGSKPRALEMEPGGNLVLYADERRASWATGTDGNPGAFLSVQDDGNLVVYGPSGGRGLWSRLRLPPVGSRLRVGETLQGGESLQSDNGRFRLVMQFDGNLVLYDGATPLWDTATSAAPKPTVLVLQGDGNLVIYAGDGSDAAWASRTDGRPSDHVRLQDDGNLVVVGVDGAAIKELAVCRVAVTLLGFRCVKQTWDDALNRDGWGDEVYLKTDVADIAPDGAVRATAHVETPIYGQAAWPRPFGPAVEIPGRIQVGGGSAWGGIRSDDRWPWPDPWAPTLPLSGPQADGKTPLPALVYERQSAIGPLNGSFLVTPSVWEWDTGTPLDPSWGDAEVETIRQVAEAAAAAGTTLATAFPVLAPLAGIGAAVASAAALLARSWNSILGMLGEPGDRPVGQARQSDGSRTYDPAVLAVDLTKASSVAAAQNGFGTGVWVVPRQDSDDLGGGRYELFLKVTYEVLR